MADARIIIDVAINSACIFSAGGAIFMSIFIKYPVTKITTPTIARMAVVQEKDRGVIKNGLIIISESPMIIRRLDLGRCSIFGRRCCIGILFLIVARLYILVDGYYPFF